MLSRKTIENLSDKLMVEVANYVTEDPRFTELLNELVPEAIDLELGQVDDCLLYTSPSPRDLLKSRMPSSA